MQTKSVVGAVLMLSLMAGCSTSSPGEDDERVDTSKLEQTSGPKSCYTEYSDVVPAHIDYASVHCEGWTGKVFCEYESLSSVYGPGWGTCQCYDTVCADYAGRPCRTRSACER